MILHFILGSCFGSFFCLVAQRIPINESILSLGSHCNHCQTRLAWYELIPLLSILWQNFHCRYCHCKLPISYFLAEVVCGALFSWHFYFYSWDLLLLFWISMAFLLSLMDIFYLLIDSLLLYLMWGILWLSWFLNANFHWKSVLLVIFVMCLILSFVPRSLGIGDCLLLICWSGGLSLVSLAQLLFVASLLGVTYFVFYYVCYRKQLVHLPFIPFLTMGLIIVLSSK